MRLTADAFCGKNRVSFTDRLADEGYIAWEQASFTPDGGDGEVTYRVPVLLSKGMERLESGEKLGWEI